MERSILKVPLSKIFAVPFALQNRALIEGENRAKTCPEKGGKRVASRGGKKEKRTRENSSVTNKVGSVPTTPDPNTSAKVSRYKWEAYRDTNWWCIYYYLPTGGHAFAKASR